MMITESRTECGAQHHDTGYAYRKHGCRCPMARSAEVARKAGQRKRRRSAEERAFRSFESGHRMGAYTKAGVPPFFWDPRRGCAGVKPDVMFPDARLPHQVEAAVAICRPCPFKTRCHEWAVGTGQIAGMWGGVTELQRRREIFALLNTQRACAHVWPDELTPDAQCLLGCGLAYADWSDDSATTSLSSTSSMPTGVAS